MKKLLTILLTLAFLLPACSAAAMAEEPVLLRVAAFMGENEPDGFLTDPVTQYIEDSLNVRLGSDAHPRRPTGPTSLRR